MLLINPGDMEKAGLQAGQIVTLVGDAEDGVPARSTARASSPSTCPKVCVGGYYPEMNPLVPLGYHDFGSKTPAGKAVPVRIHRQSIPAERGDDGEDSLPCRRGTARSPVTCCSIWWL